MPTSINGIGTTYYGKRDLEQEPGVCEHCQNHTTLSSYETTHFFIVVFIPIIPLGKKQIIDECASCRRHRVIPAAQWKTIREEAIESSTSSLAEKMDDPKAAIEHLQTLTAFRQIEDANDLATAIEGSHHDNFDVQFTLGAWHEKFGSHEDAERCFDKSFELDPENPIAVRAKAMGLIEQGQSDDARALLEKLVPPSPNFDPIVFYQLGNLYQSQERHDEALQSYRLVAENTPGIEKDKAFRASVRKSEKVAGKDEPLLPRVSIFSRRAFWVTAACLLVVLGLLGALYRIGATRTVNVVNGNAVPITVTIDDGAPVNIGPDSMTKVTLSEGSHEVTVVSPEAGFGPQTFSMSTPFFTRLFKNPAFVLDPTQSAATVWEKKVYRTSPVQAEEGNFGVHVSQLFKQFDDVDYVFKPFPSEIKTETSANRVTKTRVSFATIPVEAYLERDFSAPNNHKLKSLENRIRVEPNSPELLTVYYELADLSNETERFIKFAKTRLDVKPMPVELHRSFQTAQLGAGRAEELNERYSRYLAESPQDPDVLYLNGRLKLTVSASNPLFQKALAEDHQHTYSINALGYNQMAAGEFEAAKQSFQKLIELAPDNSTFEEEYFESLFATKDYDRLKEILDSKSLADSPGIYSTRALLLKATGNESQHAQLKQQVLESYPSALLENRIDLTWAQLNSDLPAMERALQNEPDGLDKLNFQLVLDIERGTIERSDELLAQLPGIASDFYTPLIAVALNRNGRETKAKRIWREYLTELENRGEHRLAELARQAATEKISVADLNDISLEISRKKNFALGMLEFSKSPNEELKAAISRMNFDFRFPHKFIERMLEDK